MKPTEEQVNHPSWYNKHPSGVECIDIIRHHTFNIGAAIKYLWRAGLKHEDGKDDKEKEIEDLKKAIWYINDEIKRLKMSNLPLGAEYDPRAPWNDKIINNTYVERTVIETLQRKCELKQCEDSDEIEDFDNAYYSPYTLLKEFICVCEDLLEDKTIDKQFLDKIIKECKEWELVKITIE